MRRCAARRWSSADSGRAASWPPPVTRRAFSACTRPCRWRAPGGCARRPASSGRAWRATASCRRRFSPSSKTFTPLVEGLSLDEAFLDVSGSIRLFGEPPAIAQRIKQRIADETGLTASVGVASNKFLAKLASDARKPDGLLWVRPDQVQSFLDPMPVSRLWGIGKQTAPGLRALGILTIGQLRKAHV
jgi:nucleotidyltransferase/DNA polymerase involved in DNA repair